MAELRQRKWESVAVSGVDSNVIGLPEVGDDNDNITMRIGTAQKVLEELFFKPINLDLVHCIWDLTPVIVSNSDADI